MTASALCRWSRYHPEWPAAVAAVAGWFALLRAEGDAHSPLAAGPHWFLMSLAMMTPSALPAVRRISMSSLRSRRRRAVVLFLATYVLFWTAVGILMTAIVRDAELLPGVDSTTVLVVSLTLAACWELTSAKRRALRACQLELPLPPCGREADLGCVRAGALYAQRCATACWALMLPMAAASGLPLLAMLLATIIAAQKLLVRGATLAAPAVGVILGTAFIIGVT